MKKSNIRQSNAEIWRDRVERLSRRPGTILEFCQREGVSRETLRYWQRKLSGQSSKAISPFVSVEVVPDVDSATTRRCMPDAKWVAELIHHLSSRVQGVIP